MKRNLPLICAYTVFALLLLWVSFRIYAWAGLIPACVVVFIIFTSPEFSGGKRIPNRFRNLPETMDLPVPEKAEIPAGPELSLSRFRELERAEKEFGKSQRGTVFRKIAGVLTAADIGALLLSIRYPEIFAVSAASAGILAIALTEEIFRKKRFFDRKYKTRLPVLCSGAHISREIDSVLEKRPPFELEKFCSCWRTKQEARTALEICDLCVEVMRYPGNVFFHPGDSFRVMRFNRGRRLNDANFRTWMEERFHTELEKEDLEKLDSGSFENAVRILLSLRRE